MKRFVLIVCLAALVALVAHAFTGSEVEMPFGLAPSGSVYAYVAFDRDADRAPSVGDEVRWFVASDVDAIVTLTCWTDDTKTRVVQTFTSPVFVAPLTGYGTRSGVVLAAPGYCESYGRTTGGQAFGAHWFPVVP